jgi:hypothetical protein
MQLDTPDVNQGSTVAQEDADGRGVVDEARAIEAYHRAPMPGAAEPLPHAFPDRVTPGLVLGVVVGALAGILWAILLYRGFIVVPGWEALYSAGDFTFYILWLGIGAAAGVLIVGGGTLLATKPEPYEPEPVQMQRDPFA